MHLTQLAAVRWFAPPNLTRPDLQRRARALWIVSWPFFAVVTLILKIAVVVEPETLARRAVTVAAVGGLIAILHAISRSGRPELASWILVIGLSAIVTQRAWGTGGIHAPVSVFYALFIVMAGVLIGVRGGVATAAFCAAGAIGLTLATSLNWLTPKPGAGSPLGALVFVGLAIGMALLLQTLVAVKALRPGLGPDAAQMLAHDLRSPMQVLLGHLELLRDDVRGGSAADVEGAIRNVDVLSRMTDNFLDAGRIEAGRMPVNRAVTDLAAEARSVVDNLQVIQPSREMGVETDGDPNCNCDPGLTRRIIENLVGNALKHTEVGARVTVVVTGARDTVSIVVRDEGSGIPTELRRRVFEPYFEHGTNLSGASSGIGLSFCRLAVEVQGGTISVEDSPPHGTAFVVELPR